MLTCFGNRAFIFITRFASGNCAYICVHHALSTLYSEHHRNVAQVNPISFIRDRSTHRHLLSLSLFSRTMSSTSIPEIASQPSPNVDASVGFNPWVCEGHAPVGVANALVTADPPNQWVDDTWSSAGWGEQYAWAQTSAVQPTAPQSCDGGHVEQPSGSVTAYLPVQPLMVPHAVASPTTPTGPPHDAALSFGVPAPPPPVAACATRTPPTPPPRPTRRPTKSSSSQSLTPTATMSPLSTATRDRSRSPRGRTAAPGHQLRGGAQAKLAELCVALLHGPHHLNRGGKSAVDMAREFVTMPSVAQNYQALVSRTAGPSPMGSV